jgi:hypothetical protein
MHFQLKSTFEKHLAPHDQTHAWDLPYPILPFRKEVTFFTTVASGC